MPSRRGDDPESDLSTVLRPGARPITTTARTFTLHVIEGPDAGKSFALDGTHASRVLVGKSPACEIGLSDEHVSRRHAALDHAENELRLVDLGSTNGTFIGPTRIVEAFLYGGEIVRMGATALRVDADAQKHAMTLPSATRFGPMIGASIE